VKYEASSGKGAAEFPGRWNLKGIPAVYAGSSRAICVLERLVHLAGTLPIDEAFTTITIPPSVAISDLRPMPRDWHEPPNLRSRLRFAGPFRLQQYVAWFVERYDVPVLRVPSVVIPDEFCYVLWPRHPHFEHIDFSKPKPFTYDIRLKPDLAKPEKA
jgi:RES domain-containing protein